MSDNEKDILQKFLESMEEIKEQNVSIIIRQDALHSAIAGDELRGEGLMQKVAKLEEKDEAIRERLDKIDNRHWVVISVFTVLSALMVFGKNIWLYISK